MLANIILIVFTLLAIGVGILKALRRSVTRSVASIVSTVLSAVLSCILAKLISTLIGGVAAELIFGMISDNEFTLPASISDISSAVVAALAAPLLFIPIMLLMNILLSLISKPVCKLIEDRSELAKTQKATISITLGILAGLIVAGIYITPFAGYATIASSFTHALDMPEANTAVTADIVTDLIQISDELAESFIAKGALAAGGELMFSELTTANTDAVSISIYEKAPSVAQIAGCIIDLSSKSVGSYTDEDIKMLEDIGEILSQDSELSEFTAYIISSAASSWQAGEDFLGIKNPLPQNNDMLNTDELLKSLSSYTGEALAQDIVSAGNAMKVMYDNGLLGGVGSFEELLSGDLLESEHLEEVLAELLASDNISEAAVAAIRERIDEILKESKDAGANSALCDAIDAYANALTPKDLAYVAAELLQTLKAGKAGDSADALAERMRPVFTYIAQTSEGNTMLLEIERAALALDWLKTELDISADEAASILASTKADIELCCDMTSCALATYYK